MPFCPSTLDPTEALVLRVPSKSGMPVEDGTDSMRLASITSAGRAPVDSLDSSTTAVSKARSSGCRTTSKGRPVHSNGSNDAVSKPSATTRKDVTPSQSQVSCPRSSVNPTTASAVCTMAWASGRESTSKTVTTVVCAMAKQGAMLATSQHPRRSQLPIMGT